MDNRIVDLHVHSTESDGTLLPLRLSQKPKSWSFRIALTDHDTATGIRKAMGAAKEAGIELIPGIELSTAYTFPGKKQEKEIHIVGLYINPDDPELLKMTAEFRECRDKRNEKMIAALQEEGFPITMEALLAENTDSVITRANIARFLYEHGWIKSVSEAFDKYIGDGCRCYVGRFKVSPMEAVSLIKRTGGIAILAHPLLYHLGVEQLQLLIDDLKAVGLDGIEQSTLPIPPGRTACQTHCKRKRPAYQRRF